MLKLLSSIIDRMCVLLGGLGFLQLPLFMQQYQQQLLGHVLELKYQVSLMQSNALQSGKTLNEFIQKFITNYDPDFSTQGQTMQAMVVRLQELTSALKALAHASVWERPLVFFQYFNPEIAQSTLHTFQPGLSFTLEGGIYTLCGMIFGYAIFWIFKEILVLKKPSQHK